MSRRFILLIIVAFACVPAAAAQDSSRSNLAGRVAVVQPCCKTAPTRQRFLEALSAAAIELQVDRRTLPRIVLIQTDRQSAAVAGILSDGKVIVDYLPGLDGPLYIAWTVGTTNDAKLADVAITILTDAFQLKLTPAEKLQSTRAVVGRIGSTVAVDSLSERR